MTHLPYVATCYGLALAVFGGLAIGARARLRSARRRLAAIDPRGPAA